MRLKCGANYLDVGGFDCIEELKEIVMSEDLSRASLREQASLYQKETNVLIGFFDVIDGFCGYDDKVMDRYDRFIPKLAEQLKEFYEYNFIQLKSFTIVRLKAGAQIYPHRDNMYGDEIDNTDSAYHYCHRIHIPVITNDDVIFTINGEESHLEYGRITEIDNLAEHSVVNNGSSDRVHIVIDFYGLEGFYDKSLPSVPDEFYIKKEER